MSLNTRSYRFRAYPNGAQRRLLDRWFGAARWLWNTALEIRSEGYRTCGLSLTSIDLSRWLSQWKHTAGHQWLAQVPATALTQCLRDQDRAFVSFFAGRARYPRFKTRRGRQSLRFQHIGAAWRSGTLRLPKLGVLKLAEELPEVERPDMVTLLWDASGAYYVSFCARVPCSLLPSTCDTVGVDLGLTHLATLSTGERIENPRHYQRRLRYLRQQQRCLARRQKGSKRREKQRVRVARAHARWYASSKHCSVCRFRLDELRLDQRQWRCPKCGTFHDRDINAARNLLTQGVRQLAGCDDRDLRVDAGDACPEEQLLAQVLAEEARSGHYNRVGVEPARLA